MGYVWSQMSRYEKDKLIAEKVLNFSCFSNEHDIQWYDRHHRMGFWNYSSNLKNICELLEYLAKQGVQSIIHVESKNSVYCKFFTDNEEIETPLFYYGETLQDAVCIASLKFFNIDVIYK